MQLAGQRVLVVEPDFLAAIDLQHMLETAGAAQTVFARTVAEAHSLAARWTTYDLAIIDVGANDAAALVLAVSLCGAGLAVVITCTGERGGDAIARVSGTPVLAKPCGPAELQAVCATALAARSLR